jgi:hypothetical protein
MQLSAEDGPTYRTNPTDLLTQVTATAGIGPGRRKLENVEHMSPKSTMIVSDAVFNAGCLALADTVNGDRRMHTVAAAIGAGKTSFALS